MTNTLISHLSNCLKETIKKVSSVSGGDISLAYRIDTSNNSYFLKLNSFDALNMFETEAYSLDLIAKTQTIKTPRILAFDRIEDSVFLLMEYVESKSPSEKDFDTLGKQLAALHKCTSENFGLQNDNFIGSLPQSNTTHSTWTDFYTFERLLPQLNLAKRKGFLKSEEIPAQRDIQAALIPFFDNVKPSLLHGDLWSGNYLISKEGIPYLIDPAVYFGHSEVDIAMSKLFGGFRNAFYESYHSYLPSDENTSTRIDIYQLYYLLVHLNLFGSSYYNSVKNILLKYF